MYYLDVPRAIHGLGVSAGSLGCGERFGVVVDVVVDVVAVVVVFSFLTLCRSPQESFFQRQRQRVQKSAESKK
jgi:hypothetical protein